MPKKVNETLMSLPKSETVILTFDNGNKIYVVTLDKDNTNYLYEKIENGYIYRKSRKKDPCFPECY